MTRSNSSQWTVQMPLGVSAAIGMQNTGAVNKFGQSVDVPASEVSIWEGNQASVIGPARAYENHSAGMSVFASSSDVLDTMNLTLEGLDEVGVEKTTTVALTGQTKVSNIGGAGGWSRIFRAYPDAPIQSAATVYVYLDDSLTLGVPDNPATKLLALIGASEQQTMMAVYTVPAEKYGYLTSWNFSNEDAGGAADVKHFRLRVRENGSTVWRTRLPKETVSPGSGDMRYVDPPLRLPPQADIEVTCESDGAVGTQPVNGGFNLILLPY